MDLTERAIWLIVGCAIGFVLGYIVRSLREIKEELTEVDVIVKKSRDDAERHRSEQGHIRVLTAANIGLLVVLVLVVYASFQTARVNNELDHTVACLKQYNLGNAQALESRDKAIREEAEAEIDLWTLYEGLYKSAKKNPDPKHLEKLQEELNVAIVDYRDDLIATQKTRERYIYPDPDIIKNCEDNQDE